MSDVRWATATTLAGLLRERKVSAVEVLEGTLQAISQLDPLLNAYLTVTESEALHAAHAADRAIERREPLGPLHGVPISIKDSEATKGIRTTQGSTLFRDHVPDADSIAVERVRAGGAVIVGKTNLPEFGLLGETKNQLQDECRNPWDVTKTTGGSSGGAAAAVAAGMSPFALGSDGAGSIIAPAAFCGVFGLKPSQGRVPKWPGGPKFAASSGPLARSADDLGLLLESLSGPDPRDPRSVLYTRARAQSSAEPSHGRIRWSPDLGHFPVDAEVRDTVLHALSTLEGGRWRVDDDPIDIPNPWDAYLPIFWAECAVGLGDVIDNHAHTLLPEVQAELAPVRGLTATRLLTAIRDLWSLQAKFGSIFGNCDLLVTPATAVAAFPHDDPPDQIGGVSVQPGWTTFMPFAVVANLTGCPAVSAPCGLTKAGLPVGAMLVGPVGEDELVISAAQELADASGFAGLKPPELAAHRETGR